MVVIRRRRGRVLRGTEPGRIAKPRVFAAAMLTLAGCAYLEGCPRVTCIVSGSISPSAYALVVGETVQLSVHAPKECDPELRSSDPAIVTVSDDGVVHAVGPGTAYVILHSGVVDDPLATAEIRVGASYVPLARMSPGGQCALSEAGAVYCWGDLSFTSPDASLSPDMPRLLAGGRTFTSVAVGTVAACGITADGRGYCWGAGGDAQLVGGGLLFRSFSPWRGDALSQLPHSCGVSLDGSAWCWAADSDTPVPVAGGPAFTAISAGGQHTCALAADGVAYCWGDNTWGQLGDASTVSRTGPAPVLGVPPMAAVTAGAWHTCGLTLAGAAFCWGRNEAGELGIGLRSDAAPHPVPAPVAGTRVFASIDASQWTCALTPQGDAYCWGDGVGISPRRVGGALVFGSIGVGVRVEPPPVPFGWPEFVFVACGVASNARGYCWESTNTPSGLVGPVQP